MKPTRPTSHPPTGELYPVGLFAWLLCGTGMHLVEGLGLRVKDLELVRREIVVRGGKGQRDRVTVLPENLIFALQQQLSISARITSA